VQVEVVLTRDGTPIDHDDMELKVNLSSPDRTTWIRSVTGDAGATAAASLFVELTPAELDNSGRMLIDLVVLDGSLNVIQARGICILYPEVPDSGTLPAGNVIDWTNPTYYLNTATHGPVRPHSGTLEVKATNADGSISIGVKDGLYDTAGSAATVAGNLTAHIDDTTAAHAATAISNTPAGGIAATTVQAALNELDSEKLAVGGTAADVNPAGTSIAEALALLVGKLGDQVMSGKLTIQKTGAGTNLTLERTDGVRMQIGAGTAGNIICNGQYSFTWDGLAQDVTPITLIHPTLAGNSVGQIRFRRFSSTAPHGDSTAAANRLLGFADAAEGQLKVVLDAVLNSLRAIGVGGLALQDSAGAEHALLTSTGLRIRPRIVTGSIDAELDGVYHGTAAATYTDPTPAEGRGYLVRVVNGTQTVGGTAYAAEGTVIFREYHSGAWRNRVLFGGADAAGVRANIGASALTPTVNPQVGTTYTLAAADAGAIVTMTNGSANLLTIPTNAAVAFPVGTIANVLQGGAGVTSVKGDTGVTFNGVSGGTGAITARWQGVALLKVATDEWIGSGSIGTVA
jgi:hypothetical protein